MHLIQNIIEPLKLCVIFKDYRITGLQSKRYVFTVASLKQMYYTQKWLTGTDDPPTPASYNAGFNPRQSQVKNNVYGKQSILSTSLEIINFEKYILFILLEIFQLFSVTRFRDSKFISFRYFVPIICFQFHRIDKIRYVLNIGSMETSAINSLVKQYK